MKQTNVRRKALVLICLLPLIGLSNCQNQGDKTTQDEIIQNAWDAMFPEYSRDDIESVYVEGYFHGRSVPNKTFIARPNLFRNEFEEGTLIFDGVRAALVDQIPDSTGNPRSNELIEEAYWRHFEVDLAIIFPAFFDYPSEYKGINYYEGHETYEIYVALPLGAHVTYFIDTESYLLTRRLVSWDGDPKKDLWENKISNYIEYDGIMFPDGYSFIGQDGEEKGLFKNVMFNIEIRDNLFTLPDGID